MNLESLLFKHPNREIRVFSFRDLQTLNIKNMKQRKTMRQWWREQLADFRELADRLELKQGLQQFAVGALINFLKQGICLRF